MRFQPFARYLPIGVYPQRGLCSLLLVERANMVCSMGMSLTATCFVFLAVCLRSFKCLRQQFFWGLVLIKVLKFSRMQGQSFGFKLLNDYTLLEKVMIKKT